MPRTGEDSAIWKRVFQILIRRADDRKRRDEKRREARKENLARVVRTVVWSWTWWKSQHGVCGWRAFKQKKQHIPRPWGAKHPASALVRALTQRGAGKHSPHPGVLISQGGKVSCGHWLSDGNKFCTVHRILCPGQLPGKLFIFFFFYHHNFIHRSLNLGVSVLAGKDPNCLCPRTLGNGGRKKKVNHKVISHLRKSR